MTTPKLLILAAAFLTVDSLTYAKKGGLWGFVWL